MAALRCAARKLGCRTLQRPQVVAAAEEPSLIRPLSRSTSSAAGNVNTKGHTVHEKCPLMQIQQKKEELYQLLARNAAAYNLRSQDIRLLQLLSVQVDPKPTDPTWRSHRRAKRINGFVKYACSVISCYVIANSLLWSFGESDPIENKV